MSPRVRREPPAYLQIAEAIRADIAAGRLAPGERLASERNLAAAWGVTRPTVTRGSAS
jgi:GntR family transcriptional regulator